MTDGCTLLSEALGVLRDDITCEPGADARTVLVTTGRAYADGDVVEVFVRFSPELDRVAVSDGGMTHARRQMFGLDGFAPTAEAVWIDLLSDYDVSETHGRIYAQGTVDVVAGLIANVADAAVALDVVRLLRGAERITFGAIVETWLRKQTNLRVADTSTVTDRYGARQKFTALVELPKRQVIVQALSGSNPTSLQRPVEHASWAFGALDATAYPVADRLAISQGAPKRNKTKQFQKVEAMLNRLAESACVGGFDQHQALNRYFTEGAPDERNFATSSFGQLSAH